MNSQRLLILDDDPLAGQTIGNVAALAGYEVEVTSRHQDFFRKLEEWQPRIIALDLVMPDMDGVEVIAELARRHSHAKIIITSGIGGRVLDAAARTAAERGLHIMGILPKPFSPSTLRELLAKCAPEVADDNHEWPLDYKSGHAANNRKLAPWELEQAIEEHTLHVCYQPKVSCKTGVLSGFEALARWTHPVRGIITPDDFVPLAEANGLIDALTIEVMNQAMVWFRDFRSELKLAYNSRLSVPDPDQLSLSINISALSLGNTQIFDSLTRMCREYDIAPQNLIFELTETSAMEDPVSSLELLTRLRLRGFRLSIDDFGTGYSSMVQLVKLPFSEIKVDKSFVITARESEESRVVIKSIVSLGMSLGLIITAEGIEDDDTLVFLRNIGCTLAQGYLIARPLPGDQILPWLASRGADGEQRRLQTLSSLSLLDTPNEERFDAIVRLARRLFKTPMSAFALVDSDRLWFKARAGVTAPAVMRASSFCTYTIERKQVCVINDTLADKDFSRNPLVVNPPHIRFYAGCPVRAADGSIIGTLTLLDFAPRALSAREIATLQELALLVESALYSSPHEVHDETTLVFNQAATELRVPHILRLCGGLDLPCTLHVFQLLNLVAGHEAGKKNHYLLAAFARILVECYAEADFLGRFDHDKFITLQIDPDDKTDKMARWKLESAVRAHNQNALPELEIQYHIGTAHTQTQGNHDFQSLLDQADLAMAPL